jgi:hypothetical protein
MDTCSLLVLHRDSPHRPPDWRWRLANRLADQPGHPVLARHADLWVAQALVLARDLRRPPDAPAAPPTALRAAHDLYAGQDQLPRWVAEAHLLTGEPLERVAQRCGLGRDVLAAYAEVFFHVRDRLDATAYICHRVIGPRLHFGLTEGDIDVLLKIAGYGGLGAGIGAVAEHWRDPPAVPDDLDRLDAGALRRLGERLAVKVWVLALTLPAGVLAAGGADIVREAGALLSPAAGDVPLPPRQLAARLRLANWALDAVRDCLAAPPGGPEG